MATESLWAIETVKLFTEKDLERLGKRLRNMGVPDDLQTLILWVADDGKSNTNARLLVLGVVRELKELGFREKGKTK